MNFEMSMEIVDLTDPENPVITYESVAHRATLDNGILEIFRTIDTDTETRVVHQPWKFVDGERADWDDIDEGIAWFKIENEKTEG